MDRLPLDAAAAARAGNRRRRLRPQSDPATDIWLIPAAGGPAIPLAGPDKPYGRVFNDGFYGRLAFSPDGRRLVFVADDGKDPRTPEEIANDVLVVRPDQGEGYTGYGPAQVWVADLDEKPGKFAARAIDRLTNDDVWYGDPQWSPDGRIARRPCQQDRRPRVGSLQHQQELRPVGHRRADAAGSGS